MQIVLFGRNTSILSHNVSNIGAKSGVCCILESILIPLDMIVEQNLLFFRGNSAVTEGDQLSCEVKPVVNEWIPALKKNLYKMFNS